MGRGRNKNKDKDAYLGPSHKGRDEERDEDSDDSTSTHLTFDDDLKSVQGDVDDVDTVMDALAEHVENASHKNIGIRTAALRLLHLAFTSHYVPDFAAKWKATLLDLVAKNIKKTDEECILSSLLLAHMSIQAGDEVSDELTEVYAFLRSTINNSARSEMVRSMAALSLAVSTYLSCEEDTVITENIKALRQAWTSIKVNSQSSKLFTLSLSGWALLLQSADHKSLQLALNDYSKLTTYLEADQLDNRVTCGEVIAYIYELARHSVNPNYRFPNHQQVVETINGISTDSTKQKAKKDRRVQRFSFRQIAACIVDNDPPSVTIKFGKETLELDSCANKLFYDLCCEVLHGGMMRHLEQNELLRDIFDLGPIPDSPQKINKLARMAVHDAASKYRNQVRGKQRDKRSVIY